MMIHVALIILLNLNPWPVVLKAQPTIYTVTLIPVALPEPEGQKINSTAMPQKEESQKPVKKPKMDDIIEKVKKPTKKVEKPKEEKVSLKHLHEALDEIRKKAALDAIQKRVMRRERLEERPTVTTPDIASIPSSKTSALLESKLNEYYSLVWAKIKEKWTIPESLLKESIDLETIIVLKIERDGKIQKSWFEKKSGNDLYDQMSMRAIMKADPLPPIPKELGEQSLEIGIRFWPD